MKVITKRDLWVIKVILALMPNAPGITIRYVNHDLDMEYKVAKVKVPGFTYEFFVRIKKVDQNWVPVRLSAPSGSNRPCGFRNFYDVQSSIDGEVVLKEQ